MLPSINTRQAGKRVYIRTFGCSLNQSDSELMAGLLEDAGYEVIHDGEQAGNNGMNTNCIDVVLINTCTVKNLAEKKFLHEMANWKKKGVHIVVAGCIPQADPDLLNGLLKDVAVIGTRQLTRVVEVVDNVLQKTIIHDITRGTQPRLNHKKRRVNPITEIIPICEGCLGNCSYCKTKHARGTLLSYPKGDILRQFKTALAEGCKEFWITSQDCGCYGFDLYRAEKYYLPQLLRDLLDMEGDFKIRLGMCNPNHILHILDDLIEVFKHPKMYKFLHVPVQSGNNRILKLMNRQYSVDDFIMIVEKFRANMPAITISTDVIVGFPEESDDEFNDTIKLVGTIQPQVLNLSRFWLRKGTAAEKLRQIHGNISKVRSEIMKKEHYHIVMKLNREWIGWRGPATIEEIGTNGSILARNSSYKPIVLLNTDNHNYCFHKHDASLKLGDVVQVEIIGISSYHLRAHVKTDG